MHRLLLRSVANNVALKFANWKDRVAYPCTCTLLIWGMARRGFLRLVGKNLRVHYVSKLTKIDISPNSILLMDICQ
jgi:hypothetical protein